MKTIFFLFFPILIFAQGSRLLRQPTIHENKVAFVYANDLWLSSTDGSQAIRLTSHEGYESAPHFSPDGKHIAFTGQYDGNIDVYVIPTNGGSPKRLTYHPEGDFVQGWTPDGEIIFRSGRSGTPTRLNKFYTIGINDAFPKEMPLTRASYGEISPNGKYVAYTPITSWDPEWRNYRGGQAMPIWIVNLSNFELQTTPQKDQERHLDPVWIDDTVYYLSERDYTSNIWSFNIHTKEEKQITFHKKFDVKSLDADKNQIIYEHAGFLKLLNPINGDTKQIVINVKADINDYRPHWSEIKDKDLQNADISSNGKRVLFEHRGEIFTVPKENGSWRNISKNSSSADRNPIWSPKGDKIAYFSDRTGEYKLYITDIFGEVEQEISIPQSTFFFKPAWSPDGKYIAFTDTHYNLWITNLETSKSYIADTDTYAHPNRTMNPTWSPDSKWVAYSKQQESHFKSIQVHNIENKNTFQITHPLADCISPVWDKNGKYVYTLASTDYGLESGWLDMSNYDPKTSRNLYAVVLNKTDKAPVTISSDESIEKSASQEKDNDSNNANEAKNVVINQNGIFERMVSLKLPTEQYVEMFAGPENELFILRKSDRKVGKNKGELIKYNIPKEKFDLFIDDVSKIKTSIDGNQILLYSQNTWKSTSTNSKTVKNDDKIKTNLKMLVEPQKEFQQIFKEGWRYMRDFLYVDNIHGAPWDEIYEWYSPWVKHAQHRTDLNYIIDIISGEVAIGHSYVSGGDLPDVNRVPTGLLGADITLKKNGYQISKIYSTGAYNPNLVAPLSIPGLNIQEGDYIIEVNGVKVSPDSNIYKLFEQTANREIQITVSKEASGKTSRKLMIKPIQSERGLRTENWIENNRRKVDEMSNGQLAYVYVPNTSQAGFVSFNRYYFSQQDKKGVIIDERNNGGGSAADYIIDILKRKPFGYFNSKAGDRKPWTTPMAGIFGPKVMIINERAGSGGDLLPYMFKKAQLGPLVGTRTWGGLVGTWDTPNFIDGGRMVAPRGGFYDLQGNWAVEGVGVSPDIEVIQEPKETVQGKDPQLEKAVKEALKLLPKEEFIFKKDPADPVRWKRPDGYQNDQD